MYFCYPLRNYFAEVDLVYQQALPSNTLLDLSVPFQQMKKRKKSELNHLLHTFLSLAEPQKRYRRKE